LVYTHSSHIYLFLRTLSLFIFPFFFFNDTSTTEIYTLSLHDALPILEGETVLITAGPTQEPLDPVRYISNRSSGKMGYALERLEDRKSTRLNSSHRTISYAVFCLKKKKKKKKKKIK